MSVLLFPIRQYLFEPDARRVIELRFDACHAVHFARVLSFEPLRAVVVHRALALLLIEKDVR